jgi:hypothetical protein
MFMSQTIAMPVLLVNAKSWYEMPIYSLGAIAGGVMEGAGFGSLVAFAVFLPNQISDPAASGGTGSAGYTTVAVVVGFVVGGLFGGLVGISAAAWLVVAWALDLSALWAVSLAVAAVAAVLAAVLATAPLDIPAILVCLVGLAHAALGVSVIDGVRRAGRPTGRFRAEDFPVPRIR